MKKYILTILLISLTSGCVGQNKGQWVCTTLPVYQPYGYDVRYQQAVSNYNTGLSFERQGQAENALYYFERAHNLGLDEATYKVIWYYVLSFDNPERISQGLRILNSSAYRNTMYANTIIGIVYYFGVGGFQQDINLGLYYLKTAANNGEPNANTVLRYIDNISTQSRQSNINTSTQTQAVKYKNNSNTRTNKSNTNKSKTTNSSNNSINKNNKEDAFDKIRKYNPPVQF